MGATDRPTPPGLGFFLSEPGRALGELGLFFASSPLRRSLPRGDGHPVLVLPGLTADDWSTLPLRGVLADLGYRVHGWRLGRNIGPTAKISAGIRARLADLHERYDQPVTLIGWSLGGIYARDLARESPHAVRQVITLGSPFKIERYGDTRVHRVFNRFAPRHVERRTLPLEHGLGPLPVPTTAVYSRHDGIVSWRACLDHPSEFAENVAVLTSHCGLGFHPAVIWVVADRLAQASGQWRPFVPPPLLRRLFPAVEARPAPAGTTEAAA